MPIVKNILRRGKLTKQNLDTFDVFVDEKGVVGSLATSEYFKISNVPSDFVRGNQFFQLEGSDLLKPEVELKTEILDSEGNPIFHYAKLKRLNERLTSIVVEIYEDIAPGQGKLILLGELNPERVNVPTEFLNTYNVRFSAPINIDVEKSNTQPIRFFGSPRLDVKENVKGIVKEKPQESTYEEFTYTISGSGALSDDGVGFREFFEWIDAPNPIGFTSGSGFDDFSDNLKDIKNFQSKLNSSNFNDQEKQNKKKIKSYYSVDPVPPSFIASSISNGPGVNDNKFNLTIEAGKLKLLNPHLSVNNTDFPDDEYDKPTTFETSFKVQNSTQLLISSGYKIIRKSDGKRASVPLSSVNYELTYEQVITSKTEDPDYFRSYADITVGNLRTFSGDVYRTKIFSNPRGSIGDSELIADVVLESQQQLVDKDSLSGRENIGIFYSQSIVDNYWISSSEGVATQNDDTIAGSVILSGSVKPYDSSMTFITSQSYDLVRDEDYIVEFDGYFFKSDSNDSSGNTTPDAELEVFLTGSAISSQIQEFSLGTIDNQSTLLKNRVSGSLNGIYNTFKTHNELSLPNTKLGFRLKKGRFALQNVVLRPFADTNFNPGFFKTSVPMPQVIKRGQRYDFTAKFYDINNNEADGVLAHTTQSIIFNGPPQVIADGLDAKLSGSMLIGESMEMYGVNPAYLRSVGYNGFDSTISNNKGGFMLFSGSVGTRITASESYEGVGLEIVDAHGSVDRYLKFRTNPSQFEVVTDTFFLGQDPSVVHTGSFISGSQGNLQISSSNFSVDVDGNVTMSGFISASGGHIGNFQIVEGKISGSNITMDANTSTIFKTDQGPGSDTSAPFDQLRDEYYIDFTPTEEAPDNYYIKFGPNFMVDKDGILIASGATFQGSITASTGLIGGFTIGSASLFNGSEGSPVFFISGSANGTGFDKSNVFISSSGFSVNSQGVISASSGVIGNFHLTQTDLYAGNNSLSDNATKFVIGDITDGGTPKLALGTQANNITLTTGNDGIFMDGGGNFRVGDADGHRISFDGTNLFMSSSKFFLGSKADGESFISASNGELEISSSFFHVSKSGFITGSRVKFTGGVVGGWTLSDTTLTGGSVTLNSAGSIEVGGLSDATTTATTAAGFFADNNGNVLIKGTSNNANYLKFNGTSIDFNANTFNLTTSNLQITDASAAAASGKIVISGTDQHIKVGTGVSIDGDGDSNAGQITVGGNVTLNGSSNSSIAGWTIGTSTISKNNLIIDSSGLIETSNFVSGLRGFRLSAANNGFLEVEQARIRGTLATTVFEKESINSVGGQLIVANSTTITGSNEVSASQVTMSVANVTGFEQNEILLLKKISGTGFNTEYVLVNSASRDGTNDNDTQGRIMVTRGYGTSETFNGTKHSGSISEVANNATTYEPGQVIVSTGKIDTGYIRLNANPNDTTTPYIDIVERTGSGIFDVDLKARLGDLSGLSSGLVGSNPGFGLFSENVFLTGKITATSGEIGGYTIDSNSIFTGTKDTSGYATNNGDITIGTSGIHTKNFYVDTSGNAEFKGTVTIGGTDLTTGNTLNANTTATDVGLENVQNLNAQNQAQTGLIAGTTITGGGITLSSGGNIKGGQTAFDNGTGFFLGYESAKYKFSIGNSGGDKLTWNGSNLSIIGTITLGASSDLSATDFYSDVNATTGSLESFSGSAQGNLDTLGQHTSSMNTRTGSLDTLETRVVINNQGMHLRNQGGDTLATYGTNIVLGSTGSNEENVFIDANSVDVRSGTNVLSSFGSTTTIGSTSDSHIQISGSGISLERGGTQVIGLSDQGVRIGQSGQITLDTDGDATFSGNLSAAGGTFTGALSGGTISIGSAPNIFKADSNGIYLGSGTFASAPFRVAPNGNLTATAATITGTVNITGGDLAGIDASSISGSQNVSSSIHAASASLAAATGSILTTASSSMATQVQLTSAGMNLKNAAGTTTLASYGTTTTIGSTSGQHISIDSDSFDVKSDSSTTQATFGVNSTITGGTITLQGGTSNHEKLVLGNASVALYANNQKKVDINDSGISIGPGATAGSDVVGTVRVDGNAVTLFGDDTNTFTKMSSAGLEVTEDGNKKAIFGPISVIGSDGAAVTPTSTDDCIRIESGAITFFNSSTTFSEISSVGLRIFKGDASNPVSIFGTSATIGEGSSAPSGEQHQILLTTTGGATGITVKDGTNDVIAFIGSSAEVASRTSGDVLPNAAAVRGIVTDGLTANSLQITGSANVGGLVTSGSVRNTSTGAATSVLIHAENNSQTLFQVSDEGAVLARDNISAFTSAFTSISDKRLKTNVQTMTGSMDKILQLRPTKFTWKENGKTDTGFIAQEVEKIIPDVVYETKGFTDINSGKQDDEMYKTISYNKLTTYLVDTIQQLNKRIEELEKKVK